MKKSIFVLMTCIAATAAYGESTTSESTLPSLERLYIGDEMLGVKPALGFNTYNTDPTNTQASTSTRAAFGVSAEFNLASPLNLDFTRWFIGPQTGFTYSHLGSSDADFFGSNTETNQTGGANLAIIPLNLKGGFAPVTWFRAGLHGGANVVYRSIASSIVLDYTDLNWRLVPNVGADFDFAISKQISLSVRPDWTVSSSQNLFSTTAALGIALN